MLSAKTDRLKGEMINSWILKTLVLFFRYSINRKKNSKDVEKLNSTKNQLYLIDIYITFCTKAEYTLFSSEFRNVTKIDNNLGQKISY